MPPTPILFLKTRSIPTDAYEAHFTPPDYNPIFVPVLEHRSIPSNLSHLQSLLRSSLSSHYGGLIFTSQRAVEALGTTLLESSGSTADKQMTENLRNLHLPLYVVGPATSRTLTHLRDSHMPNCPIRGADMGNGEALAHFIRSDYLSLHSTNTSSSSSSLPAPPPLLFLVGETRRDIIPKTLMSQSLPPHQQIQVDELVVYETAEMASFPEDFDAAIVKAREAGKNADERSLWVVVFSPTGCEAMLKVLGWLDVHSGRFDDAAQTVRISSGEIIESDGDDREAHNTFIATIGPTTRDYLKRTFDFSPDVCAAKPSPEGVRDGIKKFLGERGVE